MLSHALRKFYELDLGFPNFAWYVFFAGENLVLEEADAQPPHKIDENMWKNREHIEEILYLLERSHWPPSVRTKA